MEFKEVDYKKVDLIEEKHSDSVDRTNKDNNQSEEDTEKYWDEAEISRLKNDNARLRELASIMISDIKKIYSSKCWRYTYPIRAVINMLTIRQMNDIPPGYIITGNQYEDLIYGDDLITDSDNKMEKENPVREVLDAYNPKPWDIPVKKRIKRLESDIDSGKKIVIHLYDIPDASTFRYACYNVCQYMVNSETYGSHYFLREEYRIVYKYLNNISLLVFCRTKWRNSYSDLLRNAKEKGIGVVMQIDDLVCSMKYLDYILEMNLDKHETDYIYDSWFSNVSRLERMSKEVDAFLVTNDYLGEQLKNIFNKDYQVIRNSLNSEQIRVSQKILDLKNTNKTDKFVIGYFSGSPTHKRDLKVITDDIKRLLDNYNDIVFLMVGYMEVPHFFKEYIKSGQIVQKKPVNFLELQYLISLADVNMVPLEDDIFTNCKSELKFFEAAIVETITVATPTYTFKNCIDDKVDGFLCEPGEWYRTIADIHDGKYDIPVMVKKAKEKALNRYSGNAVTNEIEHAYSELIGET